MDGQFRENVILQSKNGPLDFQPREPYAPIFDNITQTPQMAELQITQEYLGQSIHLVYLSPMWKEFFSYVSPNKLMGIAGVANIGDDVDWCGHHFSQANWYAFGRLAWNPELTSEEIAEEWLVQTFTDRYAFVKVMRDLMMRSREACVDYMMPLGLHHIFSFDHHYGPEPDGFIRTYPLEWCPVYYHKADKNGIGFDRTTAGSGATTQYREPYSNIYNKVETCPENLLLLTPSQNMWEQLTLAYENGIDRMWILNVGDLKPMEYPITLFMDMAWNPKSVDVDVVETHTLPFCEQQFGKQEAAEAARLLNLACKYNGRITAEMLDARTYNLENGEWERVVGDYVQLEAEALRQFIRLQPQFRDAYRELILFPIQAMGNVYAMYYRYKRLYRRTVDTCRWSGKSDSALSRLHRNRCAVAMIVCRSLLLLAGS